MEVKNGKVFQRIKIHFALMWTNTIMEEEWNYNDNQKHIKVC